jgi:hypothetical protein
MSRQSGSRAAAVALALLSCGIAWSEQAGISRVMGSISAVAGEHAGDLSTVNGSIHIGANAVVGRARTVKT